MTLIEGCPGGLPDERKPQRSEDRLDLYPQYAMCNMDMGTKYIMNYVQAQNIPEGCFCERNSLPGSMLVIRDFLARDWGEELLFYFFGFSPLGAFLNDFESKLCKIMTRRDMLFFHVSLDKGMLLVIEVVTQNLSLEGIAAPWAAAILVQRGS